MKLLEIVNMIDDKKHQQVWSFDKKSRTEVSVNEQIAEGLYKPVIKIFK